jgi:hypothetical protein
MPNLPFAGRVKFFVYIVESPSAADIYHKRYESDLLQKVLELEGIPSVARLAVTREAFYAALTVGIADEMKEFDDRIPIVHISAHGGSDGIQLSNNEVMTWDELRRLLVPVNKALRSLLLVSMSCCEGYSGIRMAMTDNPAEDYPFVALVGSTSSPTWSDTTVAFSTFYHLVGKGAYLVDAVEAMRVASGDDSFHVNMGTDIRKSYIEYIQGLNTEDVQREIETANQQVQREEPDAMAKATGLERGD